ncbi:immunoglobulin lambda-1 light chain-like [Elgaria multicarinata webbii]|uniref:immunoglobulin lambda-1 light chain-like n=1 Tax=Elgaria multicarinata webbii TaxID=159646 RepID=UPI002FCD4FC6
MDTAAGDQLLLMLIRFLKGVSSQPTLTQPATVSVSPGQTATITCAISSNPTNTGWYQQKPGQGPRYVQRDGGSRGEGIPDRFTASRSGNITGSQAEDEADYYCAMWSIRAITFHSGVSSQVRLTQPASQSVSLGQTAKLSCTISNDPYYIGWYQQKPGQDLRYVQRDGTSRGEGIPDRYTATRSEDVAYLTITGIQAEDEANYYCAMWDKGRAIHAANAANATNDEEESSPQQTAGERQILPGL